MPGDDRKDVQVDWTITHGEPDDLRTTLEEQLRARREDEARRRAAEPEAPPDEPAGGEP